MSQSQIFARPYAKAVFELAQQENAFLKWSEMLNFAASIADDKWVRSLMKDPNFSSNELILLFMDLGKEVFTPQMQNFIRTLAKFKRLNVLPQIADLYEQMRAKAESVVKVKLISAIPIDDTYKQRFSNALRARLNCDIELQCTIDENILGGAAIQVGDLVIDGSVRGRLAKLSEAVGISY